MNIFYLDASPEKSAQAMSDKHVVKMIVESAQLLSTAHRVLDGKKEQGCSKNEPFKYPTRYHWVLEDEREKVLYKTTHINHPSAKWVMKSSKHYEWLFKHFSELCYEYTKRYNRKHKTEVELKDALSNVPKNLRDNGFSEPPKAMPDKYKQEETVQECYRKYYVLEKINTKSDFTRFLNVLFNVFEERSD